MSFLTKYGLFLNGMLVGGLSGICVQKILHKKQGHITTWYDPTKPPDRRHCIAVVATDGQILSSIKYGSGDYIQNCSRDFKDYATVYEGYLEGYTLEGRYYY